jgi:hypothetical protein
MAPLASNVIRSAPPTLGSAPDPTNAVAKLDSTGPPHELLRATFATSARMVKRLPMASSATTTLTVLAGNAKRTPVEFSALHSGIVVTPKARKIHAQSVQANMQAMKG